MTYHKDYIIRMLEMMAEVIAIFLGLIKKGDLQQAEKRLSNAYRDILRQDAAFFHQIPINELTRQLISEHNYTNDHLKILSELFFAEGELQFARNKPNEAIIHYKKSLLLFEFVEQEKATFSLSNSKREMLLRERIDSIINSQPIR